MHKGKDLPGLVVTKMGNKRVIAGSDTDDDPPIYHDSEFSYQSQTEKNEDTPNDSKDDNSSTCAKFLRIIATMTVEPFIFLYMFSFMMRVICAKTMVMEKGCRQVLNYSELICSNLSSYEHEKAEVQRLANDYSVYNDLIRFLPGTFIVIFMGAWSDKYGRKPAIVFAVIGVCLEDVGLLLNAIYYEAPLGYYLLSSVPAGLSGGFIAVISTTYSLATEMTSEKFRTIKFALLELAMGLGMALGTLAGGIMSKHYSYSTIYTTATFGHGLAILWGLFVIAETRGLDSNVSWKKKICDIFTIEHVVEGFMASLKKRPNNGRRQIWLLLISMCGIIVNYVALAEISFLYTYHRYGWDNARYSTVSTIFSVLNIFIGVFCVPLFIAVLKMKDPMLGLTGTISMMTRNLFIAFAAKPTLFYIGSFCGLFSGIAPLGVRSYLSKMLHKDELGKVFAFIAACESLVPVGGSVMITRVYNATITTVPGATYFLASAVLLPAIGTFLWLKFRKPVRIELLPIKTSIQGESSQSI